MASGRANFSLEEAVEFCLQSDCEAESDIDSSTGGMSSGEEEDLDNELLDASNFEADLRNDDEFIEIRSASTGDLNSDGSAMSISGSESDSSDSSDPDFEMQPEHDDRQARGRARARARSRGGTRGSGRGRGQGRGRGRGQGRGRPNVIVENDKSYDDPDTDNVLPRFSPTRPPGFHLNQLFLRGAMSRALDFFRLFFTMELMKDICDNTNAYAWGVIEKKPFYADKDGAWIETTVAELNKLIALIIYMGIVNVSTIHRYWSTKTLYHGLWARTMMSRNRFKALMGTLHIVDAQEEQVEDKLRKVATFVQKIKEKCKALYQPNKNIAIDERMVKSKHRSGIRQYIKNKPTKFGIKLWVLADSSNGYTYDFNIYAGKNGGQRPSEKGLGYDVVMRLIQPLLNQGYNLFVDNFYTSVGLLNDLFQQNTPACGTITENRKGFPDSMKNGKQWMKKKERGAMRWARDGNCLTLQWKDNRLVTMLSTIDNANDTVMVTRKVKVGNNWVAQEIQQPKAFERYNQHMNAVDKSDQKLSNNNVLRKCMRWWKTLFFHMIDIAVVNSFILFTIHRSNNPDDPALKRPQKYSLLEFREELVRDLSGLEEFGDPPLWKPNLKPKPTEFETAHIPVFSKSKRNCKVCYATSKKELKVLSYCNAPQCQVYLHCTADKNCFEMWHSKEYHTK